MKKRVQAASAVISILQPEVMKWVTREKIKVDRVACPWLIQHFVDPAAEFLFLPHDTDWSEIDNAMVFDVPGCELGHKGEDVSFNSILRKFNLTDPALALLGEIVRSADSHPSSPHPAGEGLHWIAHGFGHLGLTDHQILERQFVVYDALYRECKKRTAPTIPRSATDFSKRKMFSLFEIASTAR
jgi:hypothetical protein